MQWYARAGAWSERSEKLRLEPAVAGSALEAPSASAVEASTREMAMEVEWREEKTRVTPSLITPLAALAVEATIGIAVALATETTESAVALVGAVVTVRDRRGACCGARLTARVRALDSMANASAAVMKMLTPAMEALSVA